MSFADNSFDVDWYYDTIWKGFDNKRERNELELESMKKRELREETGALDFDLVPICDYSVELEEMKTLDYKISSFASPTSLPGAVQRRRRYEMFSETIRKDRSVLPRIEQLLD
ncbi:hypothetical protein EDC19_0457 [Natranaerovirga hydrolytica]|uniref:Uncharacterized protein n=1 Tax=Natranaerovirga hydrolytica TaxID=680378 RepID=A0A4R1MY42_9FIRM|nr:hypothetical protein [Natranaerovirga hydrolytica]TCK98045.1 hypothetical protein EDC19_0457 [Natranaerovirga hydrolytica]